MSRNILVLAEVRHGSLRPVSLEALGAASRLANGGTVTAALFGPAPDDALSALASGGASAVRHVTGAALDNYTPDGYLAALSKLYEELKPDVVFLPHTAMGRDLAPRFAAKYEAGQVSDVTGVEEADGRLVFTRPIYAGKAFVTQTFASGPVIATVRPNNLAAAPGSSSGSVSTEEAPPADLRTVIKEIVSKSAGAVDLTAAKIVVAGGRGVRSAEGFKPLYELAEVLGAAVGASRAAADAGYCDYALQIGQTGKTVSPDLYIGAGISGAIQHVAGMSSAKVIVAINKDPEAPIFKIADYGIVGDLFEVVPALTEEFKKLLG